MTAIFWDTGEYLSPMTLLAYFITFVIVAIIASNITIKRKNKNK